LNLYYISSDFRFFFEVGGRNIYICSDIDVS
jgi:hypothetical protein